MSRPEDGKGSRAATVAGLALVVAVVGAVVLAVGMVVLDIRRGEQVRDLEAKLNTLQDLVEAMGQQLEHHDRLINTTLHAKNSPKSEPAEEVVYENEYEYDDEDEYEYDEDDERNTKATVKRTVVLSENGSSEQTRRRRQVAHDESTVNSEEHKNKLVHHTRPTVYQEQAPEAVKYRHKNSRARSRLINEREASVEYSREPLQSEHEIAAHFTGDTSRYNQRDHKHYSGNNILYHPHNYFKDWSPASWMTEDEKRFFPIQDGKVKIQKSGLYFVYAQIFYSASHNHCGFHIIYNNEEVAQCTTYAAGPGMKRNTCFTALVLRMERQNWLWIREVEGHRNTSFRGSHSYFGLIKLGPT